KVQRMKVEDSSATSGRPIVAWSWLLVPQCAALLLALGARQPIYVSRYLGYTSLAGSILVACWIMRPEFQTARLKTALALVMVLIVWNLSPIGKGALLDSTAGYEKIVAQLDEADEKGLWQPDDILLFCPGFLEADLVPDGVPSASLS